MGPRIDRELMRRAIDLSRLSKSEDDGRIHPFVGAVIAHPNGDVISTGFRGQHTPGHNAEQEALFGIKEDVLVGAVVYSTLEPCTFRGSQTPCCLRLIDRRVSEVVIGMLDPNREIRGRGEWKFEERGIHVRKFDPEMVQEIRTLNADFIDNQLGPGMLITTLHASSMLGPEIPVKPEHRAANGQIEVSTSRFAVRGSYRRRPEPGESISVFVRDGRTYYPQSPIDFAYDHDQSIWEAPTVWLNPKAEPVDYEIIIARESQDLRILTAHYSKVSQVIREKYKVQEWIGFDMHPEATGFERLAKLNVRRLPITP